MNNYKFTTKWFDNARNNWDQIFDWYVNQSGKKIENALEIGCFEGAATVYMSGKWLEDGTNFDIVDTFGATEVESGHGEFIERLNSGDDFIYDNFMHNIGFHDNINFNVLRGESQIEVPKLYEQGKTYDFIYIDASHEADDTFVDAYYADKMLNDQGIIIFDDFGWKDADESRRELNDSPEAGINAFMALNASKYTVILNGYQLGILKQAQ